MGYTTHEFYEGQKLTAEALNEMDAQIKSNTAAAETYTPALVDEQIRKLRMESDGEYIILYYGDTEIAEAVISDVSGIIPAEDIQVTSDKALSLIFAEDRTQDTESATIQYAVSPTDTNQRVRFTTSDMDVATVTSAGFVKGVGVGKSTIRVMCGAQSDEVSVTVSEQRFPTWVVGNWLATNTSQSGASGLSILTDSSNRLIVFPTEEEQFTLHAGEKLTIQPDSSTFIHMVWALKLTGTVAYEKTWSDRDIITGCTCEEMTGTTSSLAAGTAFTYEATEDCYIAFMIGGAGTYTDDDAANVNDNGAVKLIVSPA